MKRLKVLLSVYACAPAQGSELGVGWSTAREMAKYHEVWVLTQARHRPAIEAELAHNPVPTLHFVYYDLLRWRQRGIHPHRHLWRLKAYRVAYYYLWQLGAYRAAKRLCSEVGAELAHHVTFVTYLKPSLLALLPVPFIWGPVGGGESAPRAFQSGLGLRGKILEVVRDLARWWGEHDPLVRLTARRSVLALATTKETAVRLHRLGVEDVRVLTQVGLSEEEIDLLSRREAHRGTNITRFVSVGRILYWKGFHLGLRAFAQARLSDAEYWIVGSGPERKRLQALAEELGIAHQVKFWGELPRDETLRRLGECHVLMHPSLHDSGGFVCLEAMALGLPVICLDLGGPAVQITEETGFKVPAIKPEQAVNDLVAAMDMLSRDRSLITSMGEAAQSRAALHFNWHRKGVRLAELYEEVLLYHE